MENNKYDYYKNLHPDWSEEQICTAVSLDMSAAKVVTEEGPSIDPNNPDIIRSILEGARTWLQEVLPNVFAKVAHFFDKMIMSIGEWIQKGLSFVLESIALLLGKS